MNLQSGFKLFLAAAVAVCCASPADAKPVVTQVTGDVQSFSGGWVGNGSEIGKPVTVDYAYDSSAVKSSISNGFDVQTAPITSADIVGGIFGAGITFDLTRDAYSNGLLDRDDSGTVALSNVSVAQVKAPEIDPTSAISALTLLMGGLAVIRGRKLVQLQSA